jgi:hypothetical protein
MYRHGCNYCRIATPVPVARAFNPASRPGHPEPLRNQSRCASSAGKDLCSGFRRTAICADFGAFRRRAAPEPSVTNQIRA